MVADAGVLFRNRLIFDQRILLSVVAVEVQAFVCQGLFFGVRLLLLLFDGGLA